MNKTAWIVCNAFLSKAGPDKKNALIQFLPEAQQELLKTLAAPEKDPLKASFDQEKLLQMVHPSWFASFLRTLPEAEVRLFLACFPESASKKLQKALLFSRPIPPLTSPGKRYIQSILIEHIQSGNPDLLPLELLPHSPLNTLLGISNEAIHQLVEYLGLHDLAVEIRQIIDTMKLKKIHAVLSSDKEAYLKGLLQKKEAVVFKRMELSKWDGKAESLQKVLFHRGLNRLAKALYPENASLIWYVNHMLPWEEASSLQSLCKPLEHTKAAGLLSHQILEILPIIQNKLARERS